MILDNSSLYVCVLAFLCVLGVGDCLNCYHCNVTQLALGATGDPCKGKQTLKKCRGPAVCLTAEIKPIEGDILSAIAIVKTCFPSGGNECSKFAKEVKDTSKSSLRCSTCKQDGCNLAYHVSANFFISLLLWITVKFL